jgi:hypothetical protein
MLLMYSNDLDWQTCGLCIISVIVAFYFTCLLYVSWLCSNSLLEK